MEPRTKKYRTGTIRLSFVLILTCIFSIPLAAWGSREVPVSASVESFSSYFVQEADKPVNETFLKNFYVQNAVSAFTWNGFTVKDGAIDLRSDSERAGTRYAIEDPVRVGRYAVRRLLLTFGITGKTGNPVITGKSYRVRFSMDELTNAKGEVVNQPYRYAMMKAVDSTGIGEGRVRLLKIDLDGSTFTAEVEISA